jgi:hypothetical protein
LAAQDDDDGGGAAAALVADQNAVARFLRQLDGGQLIGISCQLAIDIGDDVADAETGAGSRPAGD